MPIQKASGFLTNSEGIARAVGLLCFNRHPDDVKRHHQHAQLVGGCAKASEVYTKQFVAAVLTGFKADLEEAGVLNSMELGVTFEEPNLELVKDPEFASHLWKADMKDRELIDAITGERLDPELVRLARIEAVKFMKMLGVYEKTLRSKASELGIKIISMKWVMVNKGDRDHPSYRARFRGMEMKWMDPLMEGIFATTALLKCLTSLFNLNLMHRKGETRRRNYKLSFADASRAHCQAWATSVMGIEPPAEDSNPSKDEVGILLKSLHGIRKAAANREKHRQGSQGSRIRDRSSVPRQRITEKRT